MAIATKLLRKKPASGGGTYGVSFPGGAGNYLDIGSAGLDYNSVDWRIEMDIELASTALSEIYGLFDSGANFRHEIVFAELRGISSGAVFFGLTPELPVGTKFNLVLERTGTTYSIYVDTVLFYVTSIPSTARFTARYVGRGPFIASQTLKGAIYSMKIGTPTVPNEHEWVNTTGTGTAWQDIGTVGGADLNFIGAVSWVPNI